MHGDALTRTDAARMVLSGATADVDACITMVNADVFTPSAEQSFRFNTNAMGACRQKARQDVLLTHLGCVLLVKERHGHVPAKGSARHVAQTSGLSAALGMNLQQF